MNKREWMPIALEACAIILQQSLDNGEAICFAPIPGNEINDADAGRLESCIQDIIDGLQCRADRLETGLTR